MYLLRTVCFRQVHTGINSIGILIGRPPKRIFDDDRRVAAYAQFQKKNVFPFVAAEEVLIPPGGDVPTVIFHKSVVRPQVHGHGRTANRAVRHQFGGDFHAFLLGQHLLDNGFVVIGLLVAGLGTLPQTIVTLRIEQTVFVKSGLLKLVIHIGCENKIVFLLHELKQVAVHRLRRIHIAVDKDIPAPIRPMFFQTVIGIEPAGIHIAGTILGDKIPKILLEAFAGIGEPGGSGKPGTGPNHHCIRRFKLLFQAGCFIVTGVRRFRGRCP